MGATSDEDIVWVEMLLFSGWAIVVEVYVVKASAKIKAQEAMIFFIKHVLKVRG